MINCVKCGHPIKEPVVWFKRDRVQFPATAPFNVVFKIETPNARSGARLCLACSGQLIVAAAAELLTELQGLSSRAFPAEISTANSLMEKCK